jgi:hypothetical protein
VAVVVAGAAQGAVRKWVSVCSATFFSGNMPSHTGQATRRTFVSKNETIFPSFLRFIRIAIYLFIMTDALSPFWENLKFQADFHQDFGSRRRPSPV